MNNDIVITGMGIVSPAGIGRNAFCEALKTGRDCISDIVNFDTSEFRVKKGAELRDFTANGFLDKAKTRNLDRNALFLLLAAQEAINTANLTITDDTTDDFGVCTGTTFSHLWSIYEFDKEVFTEGLDFASPAYFPSTVLNAASSHVSIYFNIQGLNATINSGYTSCLEAIQYAINALETGKAQTILVGCVDTLTYALYWGFHKLGYMAGINGETVSCPFDRRRNGPILGEGAAVFVLENEKNAKKRGAGILARIRSCSSYFDAYRIGKIHPRGEGLQESVKNCLAAAGIGPREIDYISCCANSSKDMDRIEIRALEQSLGAVLKKIPMSSIKSMLGETVAASAGLQIASCIAGMNNGFIPPTINYEKPDPELDYDFVANSSQKKTVKNALITSFGPGGYNSGCIIGN